MSQLNLQPPLGVTVPDIADWLSSYFGSLTNTMVSPHQKEDNLEENIEEEDGNLMEMVQNDLHLQYEEATMQNCYRRLRRSSLANREADMICNFEDIFSHSYPFHQTAWPNDQNMFDFASVSSMLAVGI